MEITNKPIAGLIANEINLQKPVSTAESFIPKQYSPEITSAFDKISQMSVGDQCPSLEIFKQAVGLQLMGVVANYDGFLKKFLKEYPKKRQKDIKIAVTTHVLTEMVYNGFRVGWEWGKNGKPEKKSNDSNIKEKSGKVIENKDSDPPIEIVVHPYGRKDMVTDVRDEIIEYTKKQYENRKPLDDTQNIRITLIIDFINEVLTELSEIIDKDLEVVEVKENNNNAT
jgi:hypothetical protein